MALTTILRPEWLHRLEGIAAASPPGAFVEVGVYRGGSAQALAWVARRQCRELWLYDTFAGIPYQGEHDPHPKGDFADCVSPAELQAALPEAVIQRCVFPHEVELPDVIGFAHMDCDQYQAHAEGLRALYPRMRPGAIVLCDDFGLAGARLAIGGVVAAGLFSLALLDHRCLLRRL